MKRIFNLMAVTILFVGCTKETNLNTQLGEGSISFECQTQLSVSETTKASDATYELPESLIPAGDDFALALTGEYLNSETGLMESFSANYESIALYNETLPTLGAGNYKAVATYGEITEEGAEAACFGGEVEVTVVADELTQATIIAALLNSAIKVETTEWFDNYYEDAQFTVMTSAMNEFTFEPNDGEMIFVAPSSTLTLSGRATNAQTGAEMTFSAVEIGETTARTLSTILVDASLAGSASLNITFDQTLTEVQLGEVDLNPDYNDDVVEE